MFVYKISVELDLSFDISNRDLESAVNWPKDRANSSIEDFNKPAFNLNKLKC